MTIDSTPCGPPAEPPPDCGQLTLTVDNVSASHDLDRGLPAKVAANYDALPDVVAVALAGSHAAGSGDDRSDLDLYVYAAPPIPLETRRAIAAWFAADADADADAHTDIEIGNEFWEPGDEWVHQPSGIALDLIYRDPAWIEDQLARVLVRHEASTGYSTSLWFNVLHSVALADSTGWYRQLQARAATPYPEPLRHAIIAKNHPILRRTRSSYRHQIQLAMERDDPISVQHRLTALLASYFDVLFALNRRPHPGEKRLLAFVRQHSLLAPPDFEPRVRALLAAPQTSDLLGHIDSLVDDLDALLRADRLLPMASEADG